MEELLCGDLEREIVADDFSWVVLCVCVLEFFLGSKFSAGMELTFLSKLKYFLLIDLFGLLVEFVFLLFLLFVLLDESTVLLIGDNSLFGLFGALIGD